MSDYDEFLFAFPYAHHCASRAFFAILISIYLTNLPKDE